MVIATVDLDQSAKFYIEAFGMVQRGDTISKLFVDRNKERSEVDVNIVFLEIPGQDFVLELTEVAARDSSTCRPALDHLGLMVQDVKRTFEKALASGAESIASPFEVESANLDLMLAYIKGPDGEVIELMEVIDGDY